MKINKKTFCILVILAVVASCATVKKPQNDCSGIFENDSAKVGLDPILQKNTQCKVLTIKFSDDAKCEISGSDKIDNFLATLDHRNDNEIVLSIPLKTLVNTDSMSYADMIKYYFMMKKFKGHFDSGLFDGLKDYSYKGMSCNMGKGKLNAWVGKGNIFVVIDDKGK